MPDWIEFHDSTLTAVNQTGAELELRLDAYVHCWEARGDDWQGTGWMKPVLIVVKSVIGSFIPPAVPIEISDGRLRSGDVRHDHLVPLPFEASGDIDLSLELIAADVLNVAGRGVRVDAIGDGCYVEDLPAAFRPMSVDEGLDQFRRLTFKQSRIPPLDALEAFVPQGSEGDETVRELTSRTGASRWFPVAGGHRVLILYEGGEYDAQRFTLRKGAWDHEHCKRCQHRIRSMEGCWVTTNGPFLLLCEDCHRLL